MRVAQKPDAFRRCYKAKESNPVRSSPFQRSHGSGSASSSGKHRIEQEEIPLSRVARHFEIVVDRLERPVIAIKANVTDTRGGNEPENSFHHAQPSAQNGNESQFLAADMPTRSMLEWSVDLAGLHAQLARRFVGHQHRDFVDELFEMLRFRLLIAQDGQLVLHERMPDNSQRGEFLYTLDHSDPKIPAPALWTLTGS